MGSEMCIRDRCQILASLTLVKLALHPPWSSCTCTSLCTVLFVALKLEGECQGGCRMVTALSSEHWWLKLEALWVIDSLVNSLDTFLFQQVKPISITAHQGREFSWNTDLFN